MHTIKIVNCSTGKEIVREMNSKEIAQFELDQSNFETQKNLEAAKVETQAVARQNALNKLVALGLTADEAAALFI